MTAREIEEALLSLADEAGWYEMELEDKLRALARRIAVDAERERLAA